MFAVIAHGPQLFAVMTMEKLVNRQVVKLLFINGVSVFFAEMPPSAWFLFLPA